MQISPSAAVVAAAATNSGTSFLQLGFAFVCGGLFFSSVVAAAGAIYAFGIDNVQRARREVTLVARRILSVLRGTLLAVFAAIKDDDRRWQSAVKELKEGFGKAKRVAQEGVEAISLQRDLFAAAVGIPGLPLQQYILDRLYSRYLAASLKEAFRDTLASVQNPRLKKLELKRFSAGAAPPKLQAARAYDADDALAFDIDLTWDSELSAELELVVAGGGLNPRVPCSVRNVRFAGPVRVVATPLLESAPGFGALLVSLPSAPRIGLDVRVAGGEVTKVPWLRGEIEEQIQANIAKDLLWPNRMVLAQTKAPKGQQPPLLDRQALAALASDDPLLRAEKALEAQPAFSALAKERTPPKGVGKLLDIVVDSLSEGQVRKDKGERKKAK